MRRQHQELTETVRMAWGGPALHRRDCLRAGLLGLASAGLSVTLPPRELIMAQTPPGNFRVTDIERVTVCVPYRAVPQRNMDRELPHWRYAEIFTVHLAGGQRGYGETLLYYTWRASQDEDVQRAMGKNAAAIMWDDSLGAGLQMALFDAVARALDVPIHHLLGHQVHERTPLSWWNIDTSAQDMASECQEALRQGYLAYKTKGRPWFDLWEQVEVATKVVPEEFKIDMDFNDTLLDAERAVPILRELDAYPEIEIYESPIPQEDIEGNRAICQAVRGLVAMHYGIPEPWQALKHEICDGFVIGHGASEIMQAGHVAAMADKPFWLQLVGTGITAAWSLQFGGVLSHATWPAVNCHQLYEHTLLTRPIEVKRGLADVPTTAGLGYEIDWDAVRKYQVPKPPRRPEPQRLMETSWPDGRKLYIANNGQVNFMLDLARAGKMPYFERGVTTTLVPDDGSPRWRDLYDRARREPVMLGP
ncbi:MAG: mandelate racemase/muconate lactonizing enzyme family protein [Pirellulaceae bacterium]|nr:mandelate racemase/muconate lactonizing enzyme family protein [Pirellulaceae bacterium]